MFAYPGEDCRAGPGFRRPRTPGPWNPFPYFAYKAPNNKDTLHIFRIIDCFICKFLGIPYYLLLYMQIVAAGGAGRAEVGQVGRGGAANEAWPRVPRVAWARDWPRAADRCGA